jgi:hypothetical protein
MQGHKLIGLGLSIILMLVLLACQPKNNPTYTSPLKYSVPFMFTATPTSTPVSTPTASPDTVELTTLAGFGLTGSADGTGTAASFWGPFGVAVDTSGNVYVSDWGDDLIRKITSNGVVTTLAGSGAMGSTNGSATAASFLWPAGVAVDTSGNVYVADGVNDLIRKITQ